MAKCVFDEIRKNTHKAGFFPRYAPARAAIHARVEANLRALRLEDGAKCRYSFFGARKNVGRSARGVAAVHGRIDVHRESLKHLADHGLLPLRLLPPQLD